MCTLYDSRASKSNLKLNFDITSRGIPPSMLINIIKNPKLWKNGTNPTIGVPSTFALVSSAITILQQKYKFCKDCDIAFFRLWPRNIKMSSKIGVCEHDTFRKSCCPRRVCDHSKSFLWVHFLCNKVLGLYWIHTGTYDKFKNPANYWCFIIRFCFVVLFSLFNDIFDTLHSYYITLKKQQFNVSHAFNGIAKFPKSRLEYLYASFIQQFEKNVKIIT